MSDLNQTVLRAVEAQTRARHLSEALPETGAGAAESGFADALGAQLLRVGAATSALSARSGDGVARAVSRGESFVPDRKPYEASAPIGRHVNVASMASAKLVQSSPEHGATVANEAPVRELGGRSRSTTDAPQLTPSLAKAATPGTPRSSQTQLQPGPAAQPDTAKTSTEPGARTSVDDRSQSVSAAAGAQAAAPSSGSVQHGVPAETGADQVLAGSGVKSGQNSRSASHQDVADRLARLGSAKPKAAQKAQASRNFRLDQEKIIEQAHRGLASLFKNKGGEVTLRLNPQSLGFLRVHLNVDAGSVSARFATTTLQAHELLSSNLSALRAALETHGLKVDEITVSPPDERQAPGPRAAGGSVAQAEGHQPNAEARAGGPAAGTGHGGQAPQDPGSGQRRDAGRPRERDDPVWSSGGDPAEAYVVVERSERLGVVRLDALA